MAAHPTTAHPAPMARTHSDEVAVPRGPLLAAAVLITATLLGVGWVRSSGVDVSSRSQAAVVQQRALHFEDLADGSVRVLEARPGQPLRVLQEVGPGAGGFLRGALRALVRHRRLAGLGPETPFLLAGHADGRLALVDPATGHRVDLESFGPTNSAVFARLLTLQPAGAELPAAPSPDARPTALR